LRFAPLFCPAVLRRLCGILCEGVGKQRGWAAGERRRKVWRCFRLHDHVAEVEQGLATEA
jgi:hypothetical protein